ncbi:MAG: DUF1810 domain-containing protein [Rhodobacteraceae bacterium]|jgi:uncharacterized protein (DUF1810 family)|uniref:DUF1810 domain-containing protein n=1 Tax=Albidovulum sp. TaxID=1872424 RepID=UPI001D7A8D15|nr:DUF1810 domain-containing protein [uncultured Defluviimonas sp.]MCB2127384.1 DUF1810 domain-containing protein [Paracoccaceae bacterium]MCC0070131.1 DUF1810 domain-containing protein [Paracoccaceae bacterium]
MPDLARFHDAQAKNFATALSELRSGRKVSHWMWFIFPQLKALGRSATALHYGIADLSEAHAYLADPVLRERLDACADAILAHAEEAAETILGPVDALKLRSSATLFALAGVGTETGARMRRVLDVFYGGEPCALTPGLLARETASG